LKDNAKVQGAAANLTTKFGATSYATMASLTAAKSAFDANDLKTAKTQLNWVVEHAYTKEFQAIAKLRLAAILLDEKNYDEALKVLAGEFLPEFEADVLDRKADVFVAQNKLKEARETYQAALNKMGDKHVGKQLVQIKLDALGGAIEPKVTVTSDKK
jgi:predicted negative regulator of RcsB-dependent stress response